MEREIPVVFVQREKRPVVTSVLVSEVARLTTVVSRVADKLKTAAGVTALESQLEFSRISEADARAFRDNPAHVAERTGDFDVFTFVRGAFVDGCDCVLVKLIGESSPAPMRLPVHRPHTSPSTPPHPRAGGPADAAAAAAAGELLCLVHDWRGGAAGRC